MLLQILILGMMYGRSFFRVMICPGKTVTRIIPNSTPKLFKLVFSLTPQQLKWLRDNFYGLGIKPLTSACEGSSRAYNWAPPDHLDLASGKVSKIISFSTMNVMTVTEKFTVTTYIIFIEDFWFLFRLFCGDRTFDRCLPDEGG